MKKEKLMSEGKITGRKRFVGEVVSDKSDKTVTVKVVRRKLDSLLKKNFLRSKKYAAHDELNQYKVGDQVVIEESRPFSKTKKWQVLEKNNKN